jgi:putative transposase
VSRSDGYYIQLVIDSERNISIQPTGKTIGSDVGLSAFYTDSQGWKVENPRHLRQSEKACDTLQRRVSKRKKGSNNRKKAVGLLGRLHLKVSRQRKDFAIKTALCVVKSKCDSFSLQKLAQIQNHVCRSGGESLDNGEELHKHDKIPRSQGGLDTDKNLELFHAYCHQ